jgi:hypothetical protein
MNPHQQNKVDLSVRHWQPPRISSFREDMALACGRKF